VSASMNKPWLDATSDVLAEIPVGTGVYEIRDPTGDVIDIGYAGSKEPFGLRSALQRLVHDLDSDALQLRYELHVQYHSRYVELVLSHRARHESSAPESVAHRMPAVHGRLTPG
jgi:hypothetical protein